MKATVSKDELRFFLKRKLEKKMQQGFVFFQDTGINGLDADTLMQNFATTYQVDIKKSERSCIFPLPIDGCIIRQQYH